VSRLAGRVALITGGASGIGEGVARRFAVEGAKVVIADIDEAKARAVIDDLGAVARFIRCDHRVRGEDEAAVAFAVKTFGRLDILHNNAGGPFAGAFDSADDATIERVVGVNLVGSMKMTQAALPALRKAAKDLPGGAAILFTSSLQGIKARPNFSFYTAAKHGLVGLTKSLALELAPDNIRVNAICPTVIETPMLPKFLPGMADDMDEARRRFRAGIPLGRMPEPIDVGHAAVYLASDEARLITGIALPIDGGQMAG